MELKNKYNTYYIVSLIDNEINLYEENIKKKDELESNLNMCEDLINIIDSKNYNLIKHNLILFDSYIPIFFSIMDTNNKLVRNFKSAVYTCALIDNNPDKYPKDAMNKYEQEIKRMYNHLREYYTKKKIEIQNYNQRITEEELIELKRIKNYFKFGNVIDAYSYKILKKIFKFYAIKDTELIYFLEVIKTFNNKISLGEKNKKIDFNELNKVTNMLKSGFELIEIPYIEDKSMKKQLDNFISSIKQVANSSFEDAKKMLPLYTKGEFEFGNNLTIEDFNYLIKSIMLYYQKVQLEMIDELKKIENYENKEYRDMIVDEYKKSILRYCFFRKFYYGEIEKFKADQEQLSDMEDVNTLYYAIGGSSEKCLFERDLGDISPDRYEEIENLLNRFKKGKLKPTESKVLLHGFEDLLELRGDQIRILYKHLKGKEYVILGCFLKKNNNDIPLYRKFDERTNNNYISSDEAENSINGIFSKKHKGGRNKS